MWAFVVGALAGRGLRNASLPDSVKQQRYDARQASRAARSRRWAESELASRVFVALVVVLSAACVVGLAYIVIASVTA